MKRAKGEIAHAALRKPVTFAQTVAGIIAVSTAITAFICACYWAHSTNTTDKFLGGLNWNDKVFNWHVVCMISFFCCMSMALVSFRFLPLGKPINKLLHVFWHCSALFCLIVGLIAVFKSHNTKSAGLKPNLYSLHSWVGIAVTLTYGQNYVLGIICYATDFMPIKIKALYMPYHTFLGEIAFYFSVAAIESGIMEKNSFNGCSYTLSGKDYNPAENYLDIPAGCRLSNGIGMLVLTLVLSVAFMLADRFISTQKTAEDLGDDTASSTPLLDA